MLNSDRFFPPEPSLRSIARSLYEEIADLPIVSPHGHVDARSLGTNAHIDNPVAELVLRDHYLLRMLYSQGISLDQLGVGRAPLTNADADFRQVWRTLASNYSLFLGTPSKFWLDHTLQEVVGITAELSAETADETYDRLVDFLGRDDSRPRALVEHFGIEFLATTDSAVADLSHHASLRELEWKSRVVPTFRPDDVTDPSDPRFSTNLERLGELTNCDVTSWSGYLDALRIRRQAFIDMGATATDHGPRTAQTFDLNLREAELLFATVVSGAADAVDVEVFRGQMLVEMAKMSLDDGLVMQLHAGAWRGHNHEVTEHFGPDKGADIPVPMNYVGALKPLLDKVGNEFSLCLVVYTLDESTYSRELAPLAGHYPALRLGPPWWFHDSPEGIDRYLRSVIETAGFANLSGFNDDARSILTIPARHDVFRRCVASHLAGLVGDHRLDLNEAREVAIELSVDLARRTFRVPT
jgi:glucuronate isomerase